MRIIKDIQPKYFIFENVPGIASGKHKKFLEELIDELEKIGYQVEKPIKILDASLYGAPQRRKRLIIMGSRNDLKKVTYPSAIDSQGFNYVSDAISDLENINVFTDCDLGIDSKKLDYSNFRNNFYDFWEFTL